MTRRAPAKAPATVGTGVGPFGVPKRRKRAPAGPASYTAWPCVILAIDPGETSGWAVMRGGHVPGTLTSKPACGATSGSAGRAEAINTAVAFAKWQGLPLVVVAETWPRRMAGGLRVGAFASWQGWREALAEAKVPKRRIVRAQMARWSAKVLGSAFLTTEARRARSLVVANARFGLALGPDDHDVAAALCLGIYATHAAEVGAVLPKGRAKR